MATWMAAGRRAATVRCGTSGCCCRTGRVHEQDAHAADAVHARRVRTHAGLHHVLARTHAGLEWAHTFIADVKPCIGRS